MKAMTFREATVPADVMIRSDKWAMEPKYDGVRCLVDISDSCVKLLNRNGQPLNASSTNAHREPLRRAFESMRLQGRWVFDGELLEDGVMIVFDLPVARHSVVMSSTAHPYESRREVLERLAELAGWGSSIRLIRLATQVTSEEDKRVLFETIQETGGEGVMFKLAGAPYEERRTKTAGTKVKFTKTADVVVKAPGAEGKESCTIVVFDASGDELVVGHCSTHQKPTVREGDVIEVRYLYVGANGHLVQPRMVRVRGDKYQSECGVDQLDGAAIKKWVA